MLKIFSYCVQAPKENAPYALEAEYQVMKLALHLEK